MYVLQSIMQRSVFRGGVGKSVITSAVVRSQEIRERFIDGIACEMWFMRLVLSEMNDSFWFVCNCTRDRHEPDTLALGSPAALFLPTDEG